MYWQISNISKTNHTYRSFKRKKNINQKVLKMSELSNFNTDGMKEKFQAVDTTKSLSEALNLESVNPQYDKRLFIGFPEKYKLCTNIVLNLKTKNEKQFCTQHVLNLYISGNSMNNLMSYCGLTDARMRSSDKDLPVQCCQAKSNCTFFDDRF